MLSPSRDIIVATPSRIAVSDTAVSPSVGGVAGDWTPMNLRKEAGSRGEAVVSLGDARFCGETAGCCGDFEVSGEP